MSKDDEFRNAAIYGNIAGGGPVRDNQMSKDELKSIVLELLADEDVIAALYRPLYGDQCEVPAPRDVILTIDSTGVMSVNKGESE